MSSYWTSCEQNISFPAPFLFTITIGSGWAEDSALKRGASALILQYISESRGFRAQTKWKSYRNMVDQMFFYRTHMCADAAFCPPPPSNSYVWRTGWETLFFHSISYISYQDWILTCRTDSGDSNHNSSVWQSHIKVYYLLFQMIWKIVWNSRENESTSAILV